MRRQMSLPGLGRGGGGVVRSRPRSPWLPEGFFPASSGVGPLRLALNRRGWWRLLVEEDSGDRLMAGSLNLASVAWGLCRR